MSIKALFARPIQEYISDCKRRGFAEGTVGNYWRALQKFCTWLSEFYPAKSSLSEVTRADLSEYQKHLSEVRYKRGKKERRLSILTQRNRMLTILYFFRFLVARQEVLSDPGSAISLPRAPRRIPRNYLSVREMRKLLSTCDLSTHVGVRNRAALEVLYSCGIRRGELLRLQLNDCNLEEGYLTVREGKGKKDRVVPIGKAAVYFLSGYLKDSRPALMGSKQHPYVFCSRFGDPLSKDGLHLLLWTLSARAGIKRRITPHALRHTCATAMLRGRADIRHIQELLGHASLSSTQIYTRVEISDLKKVHARCHPREKEPIEKK
jgi:integrase/recombinase XerD